MIDDIMPRTDLVLAQINYLKQLAPTVLPANQAANPASQQLEYPQIVVQLPQKIDLPMFRNGQVGRYSSHIDYYYDLNLQQDLMDVLTMSEYGLTRLALSRYPCRYVRGSLNAQQPIADNSTSRPLWHGVILLDYEILERG